MNRAPMSAAVAGAVASIEHAAEEGKRTVVARRRLTVDLRIEAEAGDDSALAPLVAEALLEFIERGENKAAGVFESKRGLDVKWRSCNEFFDRAGFRVHVDGDPGKHPVPIGLAHVNADASVITIKGVGFSAEMFQLMANPDPAKAFRFKREGDAITMEVVTIKEPA